MRDLPPAVPRRPIHTRKTTFEGFLREDGLWDIDCTLSDTKSVPIQMRERGLLPAGEPVHLLRVRLTVDDGFTIRAVETAAIHAPFDECQVPADAPMQKLVGLTMGPGWRKMIEGAIGGVGGCTHLRELVFNAATAAFQMIPHYRATEGGRKDDTAATQGGKPPFYMGQCMTWSFEGPVVQRLAPQFYRKRT
ncbi:DUF2889 domain-containing protein [Ramlibacter sp. USB13]|uniref:DUF2889 domain-containing protein n=1 Tax=Ramlibacter cellulosilyticus TaxID=2764187 RepID=A0A923MUZ3_9BURK|nr:DUF2889 domain-containing protein [Ramlibacter cellulosilyticus]MBC5786347.1 DUF2889 domain-containing protein [Ramlibacter cellulosilyticus]